MILLADKENLLQFFLSISYIVLPPLLYFCLLSYHHYEIKKTLQY